MIYFNISEFYKSSIANAYKIDNLPPPAAISNIEYLINLLDKVREMYGAPIYVNSGYRCKKLNDKVGGAKNSQHLEGKAADITVGSKEKNKILFNLIKDNFDFDLLINEYNYSWVHVSLDKDKDVQRHLILNIK